MLKIGYECNANEGLTGWGGRKIARLWLVKMGRITADCPERGRIVYAVLGLHKNEDGTCAGWGSLCDGVSLAEVKKWMRAHGDAENAHPIN